MDAASSKGPLSPLIRQYKEDPESVFNTWFINNEERLKAFRSIRRGVQQVVNDIKGGQFGNDFKGTSLEFVLSVITEQKQVFAGASHPFYWKPKLRIPDIYENEGHKIAFGQFLECCLHAKNKDQILREIIRLDERKIKGLGPAVALYKKQWRTHQVHSVFPFAPTLRCALPVWRQPPDYGKDCQERRRGLKKEPERGLMACQQAGGRGVPNPIWGGYPRNRNSESYKSNIKFCNSLSHAMPLLCTCS